MHIEIYKQDGNTPMSCALCEQLHELQGVELLLIGGGFTIGNICAACLLKGEEGIREVLLAQAEFWQLMAQVNLAAAEEPLESSPSIEELRVFQRLASS